MSTLEWSWNKQSCDITNIINYLTAAAMKMVNNMPNVADDAPVVSRKNVRNFYYTNSASNATAVTSVSQPFFSQPVSFLSDSAIHHQFHYRTFSSSSSVVCSSQRVAVTTPESHDHRPSSMMMLADCTSVSITLSQVVCGCRQLSQSSGRLSDT